MLHIAYIGIGSNLGDRRANIAAAMERLRAAADVHAVCMSSLHETAPVGGPPGQGPYLNAAARVETTLGAHELLQLLLTTENELGRVRAARWGPRTIDLDLLLFDGDIIDTPELSVPHPRMHERRFVLAPLAEMAGEKLHPLLHQTIADLLNGLPG